MSLVISTSEADWSSRAAVLMRFFAQQRKIESSKEHVRLISSGVSSPCSPRHCCASSSTPASPFFFATFSSVPSASVSSDSSPTHSPFFSDDCWCLTNLGFSSTPSESLLSLLPGFVFVSLFLSRLRSDCYFLCLSLPLRISVSQRIFRYDMERCLLITKTQVVQKMTANIESINIKFS